MGDNDEPLFVREKFGDRHYVFNYKNPVGLACIVALLIGTVAFLGYMASDASHPDRPSPSPIDYEKIRQEVSRLVPQPTWSASTVP